MDTITINRKQAIGLLEKVRKTGQFFGVEFIKKSGELRRMSAKLGVKPPPSKTGKPMAYNPKSYGLRVVYEVSKKQYRMLNINTLCCINCGGTRYEVKGNDLDKSAYLRNTIH